MTVGTNDQGPLTALQLDVLRVLWARPGATVREVQAALRPGRDLAPTTVATLLKRLVARGLVAHDTSGRQFLYRALVAEAEVETRAVEEVASNVFAGDLLAFASRLLGRDDVTDEDLAEIRRLIDERMGET